MFECLLSVITDLSNIQEGNVGSPLCESMKICVLEDFGNQVSVLNINTA